MKSNYCIALTACPNPDVATQLARQVVEQQLAACVNIIPAVQSIYQWQGKIEQENESLLIMKTEQQYIASLESFIQNHHPYEVPEFITTTIESGSKAYLDWITASLSSDVKPCKID